MRKHERDKNETAEYDSQHGEYEYHKSGDNHVKNWLRISKGGRR